MAQRTKLNALIWGAALTMGLVCAFLIVLAGRSAQAGARKTELPQGGATWMQGTLSDARGPITDTSDQFVKCDLIAQETSTDGVKLKCWVQLPTPPGGTPTPPKWCWTYNRMLVDAAQAINGDSFIKLTFNDGICTSLTVTNSSEYTPKGP